MDWYYADASQNQQSVPESELENLVASGAIRPTTLVWNETMSDWKPAGQVRPDLFPVSDAPPALAPMPGAAAPRAGGDGPVLFPSGVVAPTAHPADTLSILALVFGILGLVLAACWIGVLFAIAGVVCGHIARKKIRDTPMPSNKGGMALAGVILGYVGIVAFLALVAFVIVASILGQPGLVQ